MVRTLVICVPDDPSGILAFLFLMTFIFSHLKRFPFLLMSHFQSPSERSMHVNSANRWQKQHAIHLQINRPTVCKFLIRGVIYRYNMTLISCTIDGSRKRFWGIYKLQGKASLINRRLGTNELYHLLYLETWGTCNNKCITDTVSSHRFYQNDRRSVWWLIVYMDIKHTAKITFVPKRRNIARWWTERKLFVVTNIITWWQCNFTH